MAPALKQSDLFEDQKLPAGFLYEPSVLSSAQEQELVKNFQSLPFQPFKFHGFLGNRRVVSFGWRYDYGARRIEKSEPIPAFLEGLKREAAALAHRDASAFQQVLVTEYAPGAGIGWHRDKPQFETIVAFSFLSPCTLRFRRESPQGWLRQALVIEPRSAYVLDGPARSEWQHSIPAVEELRYSVTLRTMAPLKTSPAR